MKKPVRVSLLRKTRTGQSLVEAGGIEPPSDMGQPWRRYRFSLRLIVVRGEAGNGLPRSKVLCLFHPHRTKNERSIHLK